MDKTRLPKWQTNVPPQRTLLDSRAVVTEAYTVIPRGSMTDIVASRLPFWINARAWILASPVPGFCATFSHYLMEVSPGGGSEIPDTEDDVQSVLFVTAGTLKLTLDGEEHTLECGSYVYMPPSAKWTLLNTGTNKAEFHWIRKPYQQVTGIGVPAAFVSHEEKVEPNYMPDCDESWSTKRFVDPDDLSHDMHVNIVSFKPGCVLPFLETHVMEHGLYVLEGKGVYNLNQDWVEVEAGDFMWLRAYCPQACYAGGDGVFTYLLYKDVNRHMSFPAR